MVYIVEKTKLFWMLCGALTASSVLSGCGQISPEAVQQESFPKSRQERVQVRPERISGSWESECSLEDSANRRYEQVTLTVLDSGYLQERTYFSDSRCSQAIWKMSIRGSATIQLDQMTFYPHSVEIISYHEFQTSLLNMGDQPKDRTCGAEQLFVTQQPQKFQAAKCLEVPELKTRLDLYGRRDVERELFVDDRRFRRPRK